MTRANSHLLCSNLQITNVMGKVPMNPHPPPPYDQEYCSSMHNCSYYRAPYMYGPTYSMPHFQQPSPQRTQGSLSVHATLASPQLCIPYTERVYFPSHVGSPYLNSQGRAQIPHPFFPQTILESQNTQVYMPTLENGNIM